MKDPSDEQGEATDEQSEDTSSNLLADLRKRSPEAWRKLVPLHGPLVFRWCRKLGVAENDVQDVVQDVFGAVYAGIGRFRRESENDSFRGWLYGITRNKVMDYFRARNREEQAMGGTDALRMAHNVAAREEKDVTSNEDVLELYRRALEVIRNEFEPATWQAFWEVVVNDRKPADVALDLEISVNAVYIAKSRVLNSVRKELGILLD